MQTKHKEKILQTKVCNASGLKFKTGKQLGLQEFADLPTSDFGN
jgi:hypothetical protein